MIEKIKTRVCTCCKEEKLLTEEFYYKEKSAKDGFRAKCKDCTKKKYKLHGDFNIGDWYDNKTDRFKNIWSFKDIKWIYDNYCNINKQVLIDKFPNFKYKTIHNIISQWDIRKIKKNENWSNEDIKFLKDNYPSMSQDELQEKFSFRTWDAIKNKASKLNIRRDEETLFMINSKAHKGFIVSEETRRKQSVIRRGSNNYNWKGGLSPLHPYFRGILYEWKIDSLKQYNYKCSLTNNNNRDLEIHHINKNFSDIILETFDVLNIPMYKDMSLYSDGEIKLINKTFLELNYTYGLGIPLSRNIHRLFHTLYGTKNNNEKQFCEFKERYYDGDFEESLKIRNNKRDESKKRKYKRLKPEEVIHIRKLLNKGFPTSYIAKKYGMKNSAIYNIKINKSWKNIS